jgi:hypothetical protein
VVAVLEVVVDAEADRGVEGHALDLSGGEEAHLEGFLGGGGELAADGAAGEADGELLADLAVAVLDDVVGVGVDASRSGRTLRPVSSSTSRTAVCAMVSPTSMRPPGIDQRWLSRRRCSRIRP